jgi:hypothetical protein
VLALARYWAEHTAAITAFEAQHPARCHRIRYEDLVTSPEATAAAIFTFLGVPPAPGITTRCFTTDRERFGAGDFKIWNTSQITTTSTGSGWLIPAAMIPEPLTGTINDLAATLGYLPITSTWGTAHRPADLRTTPSGHPHPAPTPATGAPGPLPPGTRLLAERLQASLRRASPAFTRAWHPHTQHPFLLAATAPASTTDDTWWHIDLNTRTIISGDGPPDRDTTWTVTGPAATWEHVLRDGTNLGTAFRRHGMRYRDTDNAGPGSPTAENRVAMMSDLLGINPRRTPGTPHPNGAAQTQASRHG